MRLAVLNKLTLVHDDHLVKVKDGVELVSHSDDGVCGEFRAQQALNMRVRGVIKTARMLA